MSNGTIEKYHEYQSGKDTPTNLVILLHGVGSNGQDLISLAPYWAKSLKHTLFISPDAPFICDMVPPGYPNAFQWFSLQDRDPDKMLQGVKTAAPILNDFIEEQLKSRNISAERCALVGFSQGTMMSLYQGPRSSEKLAGILGYSGALIGNYAEEGGALHHIPTHLIHGEADDVVPIEAWHIAKTTLEAQNFPFSGHTTPGLPHSIDEHGIQSGGTFLSSILP